MKLQVRASTNHPFAVQLDSCQKELSCAEALSEQTINDVVDELKLFLDDLLASGLSERQLKQHAGNCTILAYAMSKQAGCHFAEAPGMSAADLFETLLSDEGTYDLPALSNDTQSSLNRTCRKLYRWRESH
jgi:hypothetical protein